jgi:peptidoglycan/LPS O-acetylase OafA/YrhL
MATTDCKVSSVLAEGEADWVSRSTVGSNADERKYRPDVDGLRAVAVLCVLLFHLDLAWFRGGFVGVDIFFVISGYLITSIIYAGIMQGDFSLTEFYARRVCRIFPALYLTIALTLCAATVVYEPHEMQGLLDALRYLSVFLSNIYFMDVGGYFDAPLEANALLQTWSLSVEEQYYLGFPLLLLLVCRFAHTHLRLFLTGIAVASLAAGAMRLNLDPHRAFFATELRVFELMIGALVALGFRTSVRPPVKTGIAVLGLTMMAGSIFLLSPSVPFPGPSALPVCVGTAMIIWAGERDGATVVNRMLAVRPLVGIGLISYSVYLLHWPLIVFAKRILLVELTLTHKGALAVAALCAGYLSWRFVETTFRGPAITARSTAVLASGVGSVAVLAVGAVASAHLLAVDPSQLGPLAERTRAAGDPCLLSQSKSPDAWPSETCMTDGNGDLIAVWGDSYAGHYFNALREQAAKSGSRLALLAFGSCPPAIGLILKERPRCREFNDMVMQHLRAAKPRVVILSAHWLNYEKRRSLLGNDVIQHVSDTVNRLRDAGIEVFVVGPSPVFPSEVPRLALAKSGPAKDGLFHARFSRMFDALFRDMQSEGKVRYLPAYEAFCDASELCRFRDEDAYLFYDTGHMTREGADRVVDQLSRVVFGNRTSD